MMTPIERTIQVSVRRGTPLPKRSSSATTATPQTAIPAAAQHPNGIARSAVN
jgi:hypothetical protein